MNHSVLEAAAVDYQELRNSIWAAAVTLYSPEEAVVAQALDQYDKHVPEGERFRLRNAVEQAIFNYSNHVADHCIELALVSGRRQQALAQQRAQQDALRRTLDDDLPF